MTRCRGGLTAAALAVSLAGSCGEKPTAPTSGACVFSIPASLSPVIVPVDGQLLGLGVSVQAFCNWRASRTDNFIRVGSFSSQNGTGSGAISVVVDPNPGPSRTAAIEITGAPAPDMVPEKLIATVQLIQEPVVLPPPTTPQTFLWYESQRGDYVGGGATKRFLAGDAVFGSSVNQAGFVNVTVRPEPSVMYSLSLHGPGSTFIGLGTFLDTLRFATPTQAGASFGAEGRGCNKNYGRLEVLDIEPGGTGVSRLHVRYEQHCESPAAPRLNVELRIFQ